MFDSLVPNGVLDLSSIDVLREDNGHAIPWRLGWREKANRSKSKSITQIVRWIRHTMMMNRLIPEELLLRFLFFLSSMNDFSTVISRLFRSDDQCSRVWDKIRLWEKTYTHRVCLAKRTSMFSRLEREARIDFDQQLNTIFSLFKVNQASLFVIFHHRKEKPQRIVFLFFSIVTQGLIWRISSIIMWLVR